MKIYQSRVRPCSMTLIDYGMKFCIKLAYRSTTSNCDCCALIDVGGVLLQDLTPVHFISCIIKLETTLKLSDVNNLCCGFVVDGDMAVELETYLTEVHEGSRSVRYQPFWYLG